MFIDILIYYLLLNYNDYSAERSEAATERSEVAKKI